ncbi:MAG TPA: hypothetical protein VHB25_13710 [Gemmatimonadaceae bacterium]|nr:hypothetical protein [Gemmatimonadaceae bacterium]
MTRSSIGVLTFSAMSLLALGACRNGPNNADDTNGITGSSAAGQMAPAPGAAAAAPGTMPGGTGTMPDTTGAAGSTTGGAVIPPGGAVDSTTMDTTNKGASTKRSKKSSKKKGA